MNFLSAGFAVGAAHALVFAILALAGIGKLLGCTGGVRSLCGKAAMDFALAGLALLPWAPARFLCGVLALGIGIGGWAAEHVRRNPVCRCFGLLNRALHGYRDGLRAGLALGGTLLAAAAYQRPGAFAAAAVWAGVASVLAAVLLLVAAAAGIALDDRKPPKAVRLVAPERWPDCSLDAGLQVGQTEQGGAVTLGELLRSGAPLALLLSLPGCAECDAVKAEFLPFRPTLPFPLFVVERGGRGAGTGQLADAGGELARRLAIVAYPALAVIDARKLRLAAPLAFGAADIRHRLMHMILDDGARQGRSQADGQVFSN